jgi:16S rRNA (cytidine1402-2'-O)-methyltransferase
MKKALYIVSVPIGNYEDITLRALRVMKEADFIICEEFKEEEVSDEILQMMIDGKSAALISDCGTPLFSDPGHLLVDLAIQNKIDIIPVPGVSSLLAALVGSGLDFEKFYYYGWLSPKKDIRRKQLIDLKRRKETIVLMDTPYRLKTLMEDVVKILGANIPCVLAFELTKEKEKFYRGNTGNILKHVEKENLKGEFVLILNNKNKSI